MSFAFCLARDNPGSRSAARIAMMAMTTRSSIKVKAFALRAFLFWKWEFTEYGEPYSKAAIASTPESVCPPAVARGAFRSSLYRHFVIYGKARGGRGRLSQNHKHGLHANGAVSDMRRRKADRHEHILALARLGNDRTIGNR